MNNKSYIAVIGAGDCSAEHYSIAYELGCYIGRKGWVLVCGGLGGVMEAAAKGSVSCEGISIGFLPGEDKNSANPYIVIPVPTGMGEGRNLLVVRSSEVIVAVGRGYGTLSEIGLALKTGKPLIGLKTWPAIDGILYVDTCQQAIEMIDRVIAKDPLCS